MANKRSKRCKRRPFGKIVYYWLSDKGYTMPNPHGRNLKRTSRSFPSYEAALTYLTNVKLGFVVEPYPWSEYTACKIQRGYYKGKGRNKVGHVVTTTELAPIPEPYNERDSVRRSKPMWRLDGELSRHEFPLHKGVDAAAMSIRNTIDAEILGTLRSYWPTTTGGTAATVGTVWATAC